MTFLKKAATYYQACALMFLNTVLLFVVANVAVLAFSKAKVWLSKEPKLGRTSYLCPLYGKSLKALYPGMSEEQIDEVLDETWSRPMLHEPFTGFRERPHKGKYVNVDENGFRHTKDQGPWPPDASKFNVFLFGGSTTFNYAVADDQTMASFLQDLLREDLGPNVRVYNFGRGAYYSTQERILFERLVASGVALDMAIFIDGLNDFYSNTDTPMFTDWFEECARARNSPKPAPLPVERLPLYEPARWLKHKLIAKGGNVNAAPLDEARFQDEGVVSGVIGRYRQNKKIVEAVAGAYNVRTVFVWQPIPTYGYDLNYHPCARVVQERFGYTKLGYRRMKELAAQGGMGNSFLWIADMQRDRRELLYVDDCHYTVAMSKMVAEAIFNLMKERGLLRARGGGRRL